MSASVQSWSPDPATRGLLEQIRAAGIPPMCELGHEGARQAIIQLLDLVEELLSETRELREENQRLRDENNRLKGEQGKPQIKASKKPGTTRTSDHSSEQARRRRKKRTLSVVSRTS